MNARGEKQRSESDFAVSSYADDGADKIAGTGFSTGKGLAGAQERQYKSVSWPGEGKNKYFSLRFIYLTS